MRTKVSIQLASRGAREKIKSIEIRHRKKRNSRTANYNEGTNTGVWVGCNENMPWEDALKEVNPLFAQGKGHNLPHKLT